MMGKMSSKASCKGMSMGKGGTKAVVTKPDVMPPASPTTNDHAEHKGRVKSAVGY